VVPVVEEEKRYSLPLRGRARVGVSSLAMREFFTPIPTFPPQGGRSFIVIS
jgi:hypothetical protein